MLQQEFVSLISGYHPGISVANDLWNEIATAYKAPERHFHNLQHIEQMLAALLPVKEKTEDWEAVLLAVFYHDIVYDVMQYVTANDNEDKSAEKMASAMQLIQVPEARIQKIKHHILATKKHEWSNNADTNFLTDADLSVLGQPWPLYEIYLKNIRKEFIIYPDSIYNIGRIKVLKSFLKQERLFKTDPFFDLYEIEAKSNISREIEILSF